MSTVCSFLLFDDAILCHVLIVVKKVTQEVDPRSFLRLLEVWAHVCTGKQREFLNNGEKFVFAAIVILVV